MSGTSARTAGPTHAQQPRESSARTYRPELHGLRAVAVALVVVYHVWLGRVSGGVDVFFVLSGFLLTGQLVRAAERGPLGLRARWSRMLVRLVPSMLVVLLATVVAGRLLLPEGRWSQTLREVVASGLFLENWQLAADAVDYSARGDSPSVVQHFWSLAVQGQFFLLWPLLVAGVVALGARTPALVRERITALVVVTVVASASVSVSMTATNQPLAYFHTATRFWELALGGLLALVVDRVVLTARARLVLGWVGLGGLVLCGLVLTVDRVFPGWAALWPTGCAVLVLLAGASGSARGADRLLSAAPLQRLGDLSFTLYLWHWPVLVLALVLTRRTEAGLVVGVGVVVVSLVLAWLTHHLVETPCVERRTSTRGGYRLAVAGLVLVLGSAAAWQVAAATLASGGGVVGDALHPGALALVTGVPERAPVLPPAVSVGEDWVPLEGEGCEAVADLAVPACLVRPPGEVTHRVAVVGDSHARQLSAAIAPVAARQGWELVLLTQSACPLSTTSEVLPDDPACLGWNEAVVGALTDLAPDAVVTMASRDVRAGLTEQTPVGFAEQWARLTGAGLPVVALRDSPRFDVSMPDCVALADRDDPTACGLPRDAVYPATPPWEGRADVPSGVTFVDTADLWCDAVWCPAEVGNVLVYLDDNHLTRAYASTAADLLEPRLTAALGF